MEALVAIGLSSATAGTAAAGATAATAATGFSLFQALSVAAPVLSAVFDVAAAGQEQDRLRAEAELETFNTNEQIIENQRERNDALDLFLDTLAEQTVAFSTNGIDLAFGAPEQAAADAADTAQRELDHFRRRENVLALSGRARSRSLLIQASEAGTRGIGGLVGGVATAATRASAAREQNRKKQPVAA